EVVRKRPIEILRTRAPEEKPLHEIAKERHSIIVELDAPKHLDIREFIHGAKALKKAGIDAITLADNSLATPRICNAKMARIIKDEMGIKQFVHLTCRDRNLVGLQSMLLWLHTSGVHFFLVITLFLTLFGDFPGASSDFYVIS